jgi:ElaB/YqjD/DUF883 family membrane-anchored ribosome-binding protein
MSSLVEVLNNHINSRLSHNKEKNSYISEGMKSIGGGSTYGGSRGGTGGGLLGLGALATGAYALHKLSGEEDDHENPHGNFFSDVGNSLKYHLHGDLGARTDAEIASAQEHQSRLQDLASQHQSNLDKIHNVLPQAQTAQAQPQSPPTAPQAASKQDENENENHAASAIKNIGQATGQFVQQNPLAAGVIGSAGAIGAGLMAKKAMQNNRQ